MKPRRLFKKTLAIFFTLIVVSPAFATVQVPKGFEEFARGEDDMLLVTIYGKELGLFKIHVDLDNVKFLEPQKLAYAIKNKFNPSENLQQIINERLKTGLKRNTNLACSNNSDANCDFLKTESVSVIYDENNAAVLLFLPPKFAPVTGVKKPYYEATPGTNNAIIHQQTINYTADQDSKNITLQGNTTLGITSSSYVNMNWNWNGQDNKSGFVKNGYLNNLFLRKDYLKKYYVQAGVMDSSDIYTNAGGAISYSQLPLNRIEGVRIGSTLAWTDTASQIIGTPINVILPRESRVDIYRGDQLLKSIYLSAGSQQIDGNNLPAGSYLVTLKIYEDNRLVRTEQTPYTRLSSSMSDSLQWFLQAGNRHDSDSLNESTKINSMQVAAGGFRIPLPFSSALTVGGSCDSGVFYNETALEWTHGFNSGPIDGILYLRSGLFNGNNGSKGSNQQLNYNDGFSLSINRTTLTDGTTSNNREQFTRHQSSGTDISFSIPISTWSMSLTYRKMKNSINSYFNSIAPFALSTSSFLMPSVYELSSRSWQLTLSRSFNALGMIFNTSLSGFKTELNSSSKADIGGYISLNISSYIANNPNSLLSLGARYQTAPDHRGNLNYNAGYSTSDGINNTIFSVSGLNSESAYLSASRSINSSLGDGNLFLTDSYDLQKNQHRLSSSGTYNFSVAADRQGVYLGKWISGQAAAGLVVDMSNNPEATRVDAMLGSSGNLQVNGNSKRMLAIPAYQSSKLEFNETSNIKNGITSEIKHGGGNQLIFMAPGQLQKTVISMDTHYTWMGTMYSADKKPLSQVQPLNVSSWSALGSGAYLIESTNNLNKLYFASQDVFWECPLFVKRIKNVVRWLGDTVCKKVTYAALPVEEAKQAQLQMASQLRAASKDDVG